MPAAALCLVHPATRDPLSGLCAMQYPTPVRYLALQQSALAAETGAADTPGEAAAPAPGSQQAAGALWRDPGFVAQRLLALVALSKRLMTAPDPARWGRSARGY